VILLPLVNNGTQRIGLEKNVVAFVIASVIIISIAYELYMYLRKHCSKTPHPRTEPQVLGKILRPPEMSNQENVVNMKINPSNESLAVNPEDVPLQGNPQMRTENPK
jgi:hypothetical protein